MARRSAPAAARRQGWRSGRRARRQLGAPAGGRGYRWAQRRQVGAARGTAPDGPKLPRRKTELENLRIVIVYL